MSDENDKPDSCDSCDFETPHLKNYRNRRYEFFQKGVESKWLCELCASTMAGNAHDYPEQYPDKHVLQAICYAGNAILQKLDDLKR